MLACSRTVPLCWWAVAWLSLNGASAALRRSSSSSRAKKERRSLAADHRRRWPTFATRIIGNQRAPTKVTHEATTDGCGRPGKMDGSDVITREDQFGARSLNIAHAHCDVTACEKTATTSIRDCRARISANVSRWRKRLVGIRLRFCTCNEWLLWCRGCCALARSLGPSAVRSHSHNTRHSATTRARSALGRSSDVPGAIT